MNARTLLRLVAASAAAVAVSVQAAAPMAKTNAPGFYRMMLGDFEVTALSDGTAAFPMDKFLTNITPEKMQEGFARAGLKSPFETSVNAYLINTGTKLVLVDAGASGLFGPTLGRLLANLKASGYQPEQVDEVYITHMHGDHVGGLMAGSERAFPNAIVRADKNDADHWLSQANMDLAPEAAKGAYKGAMLSINPYVQAGKFKAFDGDTELVPGVKARAMRGHTPGHAIYEVESKGERLVVWGDLMHVAAVQFPDPSVTITFDSNSPAAAVQRAKVFADVARSGAVVGAAHISFPGLGRLRAEGSGYVWVPVNYTPLR